jgi:hypothetical protein
MNGVEKMARTQIAVINRNGILNSALMFFMVLGCSDHVEKRKPIDSGSSQDTFDYCSTIKNEFKNCFAGVTYADCPGQKNPIPYCNTNYSGSVYAKAQCIWVSNGCPIESYSERLTKNCFCQKTNLACNATASMIVFYDTYGDKEWNRNREMKINVIFDNTLKNQNSILNCSPPLPGYGASPCHPNPIVTASKVSDTFYVRIYPKALMGGTFIEIEVDFQNTKATGRICRLSFIDNVVRCVVGKPECVTNGKITINKKPSQTPFEKIYGSFSGTFSDGSKVSGGFSY